MFVYMNLTKEIKKQIVKKFSSLKKNFIAGKYILLTTKHIKNKNIENKNKLRIRKTKLHESKNV